MVRSTPSQRSGDASVEDRSGRSLQVQAWAYGRERYEAICQLAARMFAARTDAPVERIEALFAGETGYATPKVDVRAAVFDDDDRILMVRETSDGGR
jgi:hypothetical protein